MCGREVKATRKGRIPSHPSAGAVRCIAVGMDARQAASMRASIDTFHQRTLRVLNRKERP